ncbi:MAG: hypothetical protein QNJ16_19230 [Rhodobacter sp.]|nr:hypothetical protein [Rhodobacter sp.]
MIRFLVLLVVFAVGLLGAGLFFGQMHHLRLAMSEGLPPWTEVVPDDAGLRRGRISVAAQGVWPEVELSWQAQAPDLGGWRWRVQATGEGVDLAGDLTVSYWPDAARLSGVAGTVSLDQVHRGQVALAGRLSLREGSAEARGLLQEPVVRGALSVEAREIEAGGAVFGQGPVRLVLDENRSWRLELSLDGGVSPVSGSLSGVVPQRTAEIDVLVARGQELPTAFRDLLASIGQSEGDGWRVTATVPVP